MCGIAGWMGKPVADDAGIAAMVERLHHRGPDYSAVWSDPGRRCTLGHARLSIFDLSESGNQPMVDPVTGNVIVHNGEVYNFLELREELMAEGETFRSRTDTEVILALYRRHGAECLKRLRGMFAFAIWEPEHRRLFLARDRVGKKPLHYAMLPDGFLFCSEIDPLVAHPDVDETMDPQALDLYLQHQFVPAPWSIYRGIRKLPPASYAFLTEGGLEVTRYWNLDYRTKLRVGEEEAVELLEAELREATRLRTVSDVPIGALLSGGVDSGLIVALLAEMSSEPVRTFTIGFDDEKIDESPHAQVVADRYATDHTVRVIPSDETGMLDKIVRHYGEPYADSSALPSFHVCRAAREGITVALNGDGGDELLGGYIRYAMPPLALPVAGVVDRMARPERLREQLDDFEISGSLSSRIRRKWLLKYAHPQLASFVVYHVYWGDRLRARLLRPVREQVGDTVGEWRQAHLAKAREFAKHPIDQMLWIDNQTYLPGDLLVKMDIASMHCGLEMRSPLLDHKVIELCASLPVALKAGRRGGAPAGKYLLKKLAEKYLPHELIYRRKQGFVIPLARWLAEDLRGMVDELFADETNTDPMDASVVSEIWTEFKNGNHGHCSRIWALFMYAMWRRHSRSREPLEIRAL